jgi:hypothetical protein
MSRSRRTTAAASCQGGSFSLGWDSRLHADGEASLQARAYDPLGNVGTVTTAVTGANAPGANLLPNPSLEQDLDQDGIPDCRRYGGSGTSTVSYSLTSVAHSGNVAQQIDVTNFVSGARRLLVHQEAGRCAPLAQPGHVYEVSAWYTATGASRFTAYIQDASNTWVYLAQSPLLTPVASYTQAFWTTPVMPAGAQALSVSLTLVANGQLRMDDFDLHDTTD